ncbi:MAG: hypothetical protein ACOYXU_01920 [Nitrospirota bacterium]
MTSVRWATRPWRPSQTTRWIQLLTLTQNRRFFDEAGWRGVAA